MLCAPTFDTVILLTGAAEQTALAAALRGHNPSLSIRAAATLAELEALAPNFHHARLIGFVTSVVVPGHILKTLGFGAYNFHPGPPHYPGRFPAHFAIYDQAAKFGATAHVMTERVDAGPIVGVDYFSMPPRPTVERLEVLAFTRLARLFWHRAQALACDPAPLPRLPIPWSGRKSTLRSLAALCDIPMDIAKEELQRRIAAFGDGHYGLSPSVTLHGHVFRIVKAEAEHEVEAPSIVPAAQSALQPA
jgi:methionyl-tRNA formyltransferase